ncbi:MAG: hypothetical protein A2931_01285 [Candidatus Niyogibacteria bacterium RIFCSPLOWO2_01_FULL_45_48]|uniref:Toxin YoeB n=2 Tax=Candidatus Niyogiibacteriota TaxID=1817912 RepID=A0A1G2EXJ5_9BACT|nr:MAG: hypothetical protein A2835_01515 [Candidatus Niyogibacteria bacterium RIFCSPHIGHO2_01_FULL_45_28]OGZ29686.1 MAG: hypothetical protein A2931_01285 [Candidatus Niyogibacteria bacterium RIFCSPLOWO2_01_FULL_45_48]OGZ30447.1 MAG: hypothetical protein A3J00_04225 [Candidatus Niyogibacteria bacterium RIFCSPLOWO2_02_FULL_45_13]
MKIFYSSKFVREYEQLPVKVQDAAENRTLIFRKNLFDKRLRTHKLSGRMNRYWSFSVDYKYRIIFEFASENIIWFHSVGDHSIYQ